MLLYMIYCEIQEEIEDFFLYFTINHVQQHLFIFSPKSLGRIMISRPAGEKSFLHLINCLATDEVQQITREAISMREEEAMHSVFIYLELASRDRLGGLASTQVQRRALIFTAMNDQGWYCTSRHFRSEVCLNRRTAELKNGFGRGLKNEADHPLNHCRGQDLSSYRPS